MKKSTYIHLQNLSISLLKIIYLIEENESKGLNGYERDSFGYNLILIKKLCDLIDNGILELYPFIDEFYQIGNMYDSFLSMVYSTPTEDLIESINEFHTFEDTYYEIHEFCNNEMIENGFFDIKFPIELKEFSQTEYPYFLKQEISFSQLYKHLEKFNKKNNLEDRGSKEFPSFNDFKRSFIQKKTQSNLINGYNHLIDLLDIKSDNEKRKIKSEHQIEKQNYQYMMGQLEKYVSYRHRVGKHNPIK